MARQGDGVAIEIADVIHLDGTTVLPIVGIAEIIDCVDRSDAQMLRLVRPSSLVVARSRRLPERLQVFVQSYKRRLSRSDARALASPARELARNILLHRDKCVG